MEIVRDPKQVERLALERDDENWDFRVWIKEHGPHSDELNDLVQQLACEISDQIDCTECAHCCRVTSTRIVPDDFAPLARTLDLSIEEFKATVIQYDGEDKSWLLPEPCPLLKSNLCSVYSDRPQQCCDYPNLHTDFRTHSISRFTNAEICPIVFNVIEALKVKLGWPGLKRWRYSSGRKFRRRE